MLEKQDIEKLASLARIDITPEEAESFLTEIEPILNYVAHIKAVSGTTHTDTQIGLVKNVMREDSNPHESALYTKDILAEAPRTDRGYIQVKKIFE